MQLENTTLFDAQFTMAFDKKGHEVIVLAVKASYDFPAITGGEMLVSDVQEALFLADEFGPDPETDAPVFENDFAPFKPHCDVLCHGRAIAPDGHPTTSMNVGVRLGNWSKSLSVNGPRIWLKSAVGYSVSDPRPFVHQTISYDIAWGGVDPKENDPTHASAVQENLAGVGFYPNRTEREGAPLPVTAELGQMVSDATGPHRPMAFGPLGRMWMPRRGFAGTYDEKWLDTKLPFLPDDFDDRYNQAAPPDQQIPFPKGGEPVELYNLTVEGRLGMALPRDRVVVAFHRKAGPISQKIANLDTVLILSEERKLCLTWRARFVTDRDMHDLSRIIVTRDLEGALT